MSFSYCCHMFMYGLTMDWLHIVFMDSPKLMIDSIFFIITCTCMFWSVVIQVGKTVLYISCYEGHNEIVQVLLDAGMKVNVPDKVSIILVYKNSCNNYYQLTIYTKHIKQTYKGSQKKFTYCLCSTAVLQAVVLPWNVKTHFNSH